MTLTGAKSDPDLKDSAAECVEGYGKHMDQVGALYVRLFGQPSTFTTEVCGKHPSNRQTLSFAAFLDTSTHIWKRYKFRKRLKRPGVCM